MLKLIPDWNEFFKDELQEKGYQEIRHHERTGRPLGNDLLIDKLEVLLGKQLRKKKTGPKGPWKNREP
jgi:putative transposase